MGAPHFAHSAARQQLNQLVTAKRRALHGLTISLHVPCPTSVSATGSVDTTYRVPEPTYAGRPGHSDARRLVSVDRSSRSADASQPRPGSATHPSLRARGVLH